MTQFGHSDEALSRGIVFIPDTLCDPHDSELIAMFEDLKVPFENYWDEQCRRIADEGGVICLNKQMAFESELRYVKATKDMVDIFLHQEPYCRLAVLYDIDSSIGRIPDSLVGSSDIDAADALVIRPGFAVVNNGLREKYGESFRYGLLTSWPQDKVNGKLFRRLYQLSPAIDEDLLISSTDGSLARKLQQDSMDTSAMAPDGSGGLQRSIAALGKRALRLDGSETVLSWQDGKVPIALALMDQHIHEHDNFIVVDDWTAVSCIRDDHSRIRPLALRNEEKGMDLQFRLPDDYIY